MPIARDILRKLMGENRCCSTINRDKGVHCTVLVGCRQFVIKFSVQSFKISYFEWHRMEKNGIKLHQMA